MKKHTLIACMLLIASSTFGQLYADLHAGFTSRFRLTAQAAIGYRANVWEISAHAGHEKKHNTNAGVMVAARIVEHNTDASEAITIGIGGQYVWQLPSTTGEVNNRLAFTAQATYMSDYSRVSLHYTAGAFAFTFGYRLFNHNR